MKKWVLPAVPFAILLLCFLARGLSEQSVDVFLQQKERAWVTYYEDGEPSEPILLKEEVIVLDAGHGGVDPGKVGVSGILEREINLSLVYRLAAALSGRGYQVVLTRTGEGGLYQEGSHNKKREDMANRVRIIEEANPVLTVSIHQNSYPDASVRGAQVFYYGGSEEGKQLAERIQHGIQAAAPESGKRSVKANQDYYLLTHTACPIVIVECGFLSNPAEEKLLATESYQELLVTGIVNGIEEYLSSMSGG